jgi:hypothetical protein
MRTHIIKVEVKPKVKLRLITMAQAEKRSLKRQCEYILEKESDNYESKEDR